MLRQWLPVATVFTTLGLACQPAPAQTGPVKTGLSLWLKADAGLAADGTSWADESGNGHNATALSGQAPTVQADGLNGLPVAVFAGNQVMSIAGPIVSSQAFTMIAVATDTSAPGTGSYREILSNWDSSTGVNSIFLGTVWGTVKGKLADRFRFTDAIGGADQGQTGQGHIKAPAKAFILTGVSAKAKAFVEVDGKTQYRLAGGLPTRDLSEPWVLGRQGLNAAGDGGEYWSGDIAELLVYSRSLKTSELAADVAYLTAKWK
jgi:hypothetical protein